MKKLIFTLSLILPIAIFSCSDKQQPEPEEPAKPIIFSKEGGFLVPEEGIIADTIFIQSGNGRYKLAYTGGWSSTKDGKVEGEEMLRKYVEADLRGDTIFLKLGVLNTDFPGVHFTVTDSLNQEATFEVVGGRGWVGFL